jgi:hypothetical protein
MGFPPERTHVKHTSPDDEEEIVEQLLSKWRFASQIHPNLERFGTEGSRSSASKVLVRLRLSHRGAQLA